MFTPKTIFFLAASIVPLVAYSEVYLTEDQVLKVIFPDEKFARKTISLTSDDIKKIEDQSHERVRGNSLIVWVGDKKNIVVIDQVLGKHEFITYAIGITSEKKVKGVEILEYRETYGYQVKNAEWRKQFVGKDAQAPLKLNQDITNISGATLSSSHVTAGVRRILHTYECVRSRI